MGEEGEGTRAEGSDKVGEGGGGTRAKGSVIDEFNTGIDYNEEAEGGGRVSHGA